MNWQIEKESFTCGDVKIEITWSRSETHAYIKGLNVTHDVYASPIYAGSVYEQKTYLKADDHYHACKQWVEENWQRFAIGLWYQEDDDYWLCQINESTRLWVWLAGDTYRQCGIDDGIYTVVFYDADTIDYTFFDGQPRETHEGTLEDCKRWLEQNWQALVSED